MAQGMIRKRGKNGIYHIVYMLDGRKKWERVGPKKREAEKLLASRLEEIRLGKFKEVKKARFEEYWPEWLRLHAVNVKESTRVSYESVIRNHLAPRFGKMELTRITTRDIQALIADLTAQGDLSAKTVLGIVVVLREMLGHAVKWGYLHQNPAEYVDRPRVEHREMLFLTPEEVQSFLDAVEPDRHTLFLTAVMTGLRRGELLGLTWKDVDFPAKVIRVRRSLFRGKLIEPKTARSRRSVAMPAIVAHNLKKLKLANPASEMDLVFCNAEGKPLDPDNMIKRDFMPALERAGVKRVRFHDLRHTFASLLIAQGESVKYVQDQLGHASVQTTLDRYGHLFPDDRRKAAERLEETLFGTRGRP